MKRWNLRIPAPFEKWAGRRQFEAALAANGGRVLNALKRIHLHQGRLSEVVKAAWGGAQDGVELLDFAASGVQIFGPENLSFGLK